MPHHERVACSACRRETCMCRTVSKGPFYPYVCEDCVSGPQQTPTSATPIRMTDPDVGILMQHGKDSPEGAAALKRLVQRMADNIDEHAAAAAYGQVYGKPPTSSA